MAAGSVKITAKNGALTVQILPLNTGSAPTFYTDAACTSVATFPLTVNVGTTQLFAPTRVTGKLSVQVNGQEIADPQRLATIDLMLEPGQTFNVDYDANKVPAGTLAPVVASGTAVLVAGTKAVTGIAAATANTIVRLAHKTLGGTPGALFISAKAAGTGFTITSTNAADTSTVYYEIVAY